MKTAKLTLLYKRTHSGDPDERGVFGCKNCMKQVRSWNFENVIGIGGQGIEPQAHGIAGKLNWIGIGAQKKMLPGLRHPVVIFKKFRYFGTDGPLLERWHYLSIRMYEKRARFAKVFSKYEQQEINEILKLADKSSSSSGLTKSSEGKRIRC
jgi:hypothetical protein